MDSMRLSAKEDQDLSSLLLEVPGLQVQDRGGMGGVKTIDWKGLGTGHSRLFLDGIAVEDAFNAAQDFGGIPAFFIHQLRVSTIRRAELSMSSSYFPAVIVDMETRGQEKLLPGWHTRLGASAGSFGMQQGNAFIQRSWKDHSISASLFGRHEDGDFSYSMPQLPDSMLSRSHNAYTQMGVRLDYKGRLGRRDLLTARLRGEHSAQQVPGAFVLFGPISRQYMDRDGLDASSSWTRLMEKGANKLVTSIQYSQLGFLDSSWLGASGIRDIEYEQYQFRVGDALTYTLWGANAKKWTIHASAEMLYQLAQTHDSSLSTFDRKVPMVVAGTNWVTSIFRVDAHVGCQQVWTDHLSQLFTAGLSTQWTLWKGRATLAPYYKTSPRPPSISELSSPLSGNLNLRPEIAHMTGLKVTFSPIPKGKLWQLTLWADVYYQVVKDRILAIPTMSPAIWEMSNIGLSQGYGVVSRADLSWHRDVWSWSLSCSYDRTIAQDITREGSATYGNQLPYVPFDRMHMTLGGGFRDLSLTLMGDYIGFRYALQENSWEDVVPAYTLLDLSLGYRFHWNSSALQATLKVMNLLGQSYQVLTSYPMPCRSFRLSLTYQLGG